MFLFIGLCTIVMRLFTAKPLRQFAVTHQCRSLENQCSSTESDKLRTALRRYYRFAEVFEALD